MPIGTLASRCDLIRRLMDIDIIRRPPVAADRARTLAVPGPRPGAGRRSTPLATTRLAGDRPSRRRLDPDDARSASASTQGLTGDQTRDRQPARASTTSTAPSTRRPAAAALVNGVPAGGAEYLAYLGQEAARRGRGRGRAKVAHRRRRRHRRRHPAGQRGVPRRADDRDRCNALGLDITSVGNHEFDEGVTELQAAAVRRLPPGRRVPGRRRLRRRGVPVPRRQRDRQADQAADPAAVRRPSSSTACRSASSA